MGHTPHRSWHWAAVRRSGWCNAGCNAGCWSQDGVMPGAGARYNEDWNHPSVTSKHSMTGPLGHQCSAVRDQEEESRIMSGVPIQLLIHQGDKLQVGMQRSDRGCMQMQSRGRYCKLSLTTDDATIMIFFKELRFWSREAPWKPRFYITVTVMHARTWAWKYCIFVDWRDNIDDTQSEFSLGGPGPTNEVSTARPAYCHCQTSSIPMQTFPWHHKMSSLALMSEW